MVGREYKRKLQRERERETHKNKRPEFEIESRGRINLPLSVCCLDQRARKNLRHIAARLRLNT